MKIEKRILLASILSLVIYICYAIILEVAYILIASISDLTSPRMLLMWCFFASLAGGLTGSIFTITERYKAVSYVSIGIAMYIASVYTVGSLVSIILASCTVTSIAKYHAVSIILFQPEQDVVINVKKFESTVAGICVVEAVVLLLGVILYGLYL